MQTSTKKLATSGLLIAIGVSCSQFFIPLGIAKCFPIQHFINVLSAVLLGPWYALANAFVISLLRNILGLGSLLAFPGSMIGALLAGLLYKKFKSIPTAFAGECLGTGILGAIVSIPIAKLFMGSSYGIFFFIIPFMVSALVGSLVASLLLKALPKRFLDTFTINTIQSSKEDSTCVH